MVIENTGYSGPAKAPGVCHRGYAQSRTIRRSGTLWQEGFTVARGSTTVRGWRCKVVGEIAGFRCRNRYGIGLVLSTGGSSTGSSKRGYWGEDHQFSPGGLRCSTVPGMHMFDNVLVRINFNYLKEKVDKVI